MFDGPKTRAEAEKKVYGWNFGRRAYDPAKCAESVIPNDRGGVAHSHQCNRKPGFGPDGLYCKQHDPDAVKRRGEEATRRWREKQDKERPKWYALDMLKIIRQIAEGHNDPASLCRKFLKDYDKDAS